MSITPPAFSARRRWYCSLGMPWMTLPVIAPSFFSRGLKTDLLAPGAVRDFAAGEIYNFAPAGAASAASSWPPAVRGTRRCRSRPEITPPSTYPRAPKTNSLRRLLTTQPRQRHRPREPPSVTDLLDLAVPPSAMKALQRHLPRQFGTTG